MESEVKTPSWGIHKLDDRDFVIDAQQILIQYLLDTLGRDNKKPVTFYSTDVWQVKADLREGSLID